MLFTTLLAGAMALIPGPGSAVQDDDRRQAAADARADAAARRAERAAARVEAAAQRVETAAARLENRNDNRDGRQPASAIRDHPNRDDPTANYDDGKPHPREAAIADVDASPTAKAEAWYARMGRLGDRGEWAKAERARSHADYWHDLSNHSSRDR